MGNVRAVLVDPDAPARLAVGEIGEPEPGRSEALVRVGAISLNRGEVRRSQQAEAGFHPGWDVAGIVEREAADGSGPRTGARVVGLKPAGAWAELVALPTDYLAEVPDEVSLEQAATLPVAGLTALYALEKGDGLLGRNVLVTGATGGVGLFALRLAREGGAQAVALVRRAEQREIVEEAGAHEVVADETGEGAGELGPYHLILDSVGGQVLGNVMGMIAPGGVCVSFGPTGGTEATFDVQRFYYTGATTLYGFILFHEVLSKPASDGLSRLLRLLADGRLEPRISVEESWENVGQVAQSLLDREYAGKAVLRVGA